MVTAMDPGSSLLHFAGLGPLLHKASAYRFLAHYIHTFNTKEVGP